MNEKKNKENNVFYVTHSGELLFWLVIILIVVFVSTVTYISREKNDTNDYQLFLQDVDGLIVGSPVRMMGIEVGHVTKIKPTNDEVYVKFILTNPDVYIPQGTTVTVEFSGMAGSKSLELYLPDKDTYIDNSVPVLVVAPPKRLHDAMGLLNDMYKKLTSIIYTSSSFGNKLKVIDMQNGSDADVNGLLDFSNKFLDETNKKALNLNKNIEGMRENGK